MKRLKVLVACEESQRVCKAFRDLGHEAYSCDIQEPSGGHPEWHILGDVLRVLNPVPLPFSDGDGICFATMDRSFHKVDHWDLIIAHPPCTYLTSAGTRHFSRKVNPEWKVLEREKQRGEAFEFFIEFTKANCSHICIENPVGYCNTHYRKPEQIIHPYFFAEDENDTENYVQKRTCLWLKNLPVLQKTNDLPPPEPMYICQGEKCKGKKIGWCEGMRNIKGGQAERAKARSKTFEGIAKVMASQWSKYLCELPEND